MKSLIPKELNLRAGEWVRVRSREEILTTLDMNGRLDEMPFMPEMFRYCGQELRVSKRAHKTCDPMNGLDARHLKNAVHLENLRCDGVYHSGCQAGCLYFWKEAWLTRGDIYEASTERSETLQLGGCTEGEVFAGTLSNTELGDPVEPTYVCQATQVAAATVAWRWWDLRQYVEDLRSGNASILQIISTLMFWLFDQLAGTGLGVGSAIRSGYDLFHRLVGGSPYPCRFGNVPKGARTPTAKLDLEEGEVVRIKSYPEILDTLDENWRNRGLYFDAEMVPYTGGTFKVLKRVHRIIDEKTGKLLTLKSDAIILDKVVCQARYAKCRKLCSRSYYLYWREIWLERLSAPK